MRGAVSISQSCKTSITRNVKLGDLDYTPLSETIRITKPQATFFLALKSVLKCILCKVVCLSKIAVLIAIFSISNLASSFAAVEVNLSALSAIESSNNPNAVSFLGAKYGRGLYQVSEIALQDYLIFHKNERITPQDLFNSAINERIASWLLYKRIPQVLRHIKRPVTLETVLSAYNKGYSPNLAHNYIQKYKKALKKFQGNVNYIS